MNHDALEAINHQLVGVEQAIYTTNSNLVHISDERLGQLLNSATEMTGYLRRFNDTLTMLWIALFVLVGIQVLDHFNRSIH